MEMGVHACIKLNSQIKITTWDRTDQSMVMFLKKIATSDKSGEPYRCNYNST